MIGDLRGGPCVTQLPIGTLRSDNAACDNSKIFKKATNIDNQYYKRYVF